MKGKVGAPSGGRVHWFLLFLSKKFVLTYKLHFDYEYHNYHFTRYNDRTPIDEFNVIRTSRDCFRVMYFNFETLYFEYFSEPTARECAEHVESLYQRIAKAERERR